MWNVCYQHWLKASLNFRHHQWRLKPVPLSNPSQTNICASLHLKIVYRDETKSTNIAEEQYSLLVWVNESSSSSSSSRPFVRFFYTFIHSYHSKVNFSWLFFSSSLLSTYSDLQKQNDLSFEHEIFVFFVLFFVFNALGRDEQAENPRMFFLFSLHFPCWLMFGVFDNEILVICLYFSFSSSSFVLVLVLPFVVRACVVCVCVWMIKSPEKKNKMIVIIWCCIFAK